MSTPTPTPGALSAFHLGQMRHLYAQMKGGAVKDSASAADGLLSPAIAHFELAHTARPDVDALVKALEGTVAELKDVLHSINKSQVHFDGDEFHERLTAAKAALARHAKGGATG